jgi:hypothetical protein
VVALGVGEQVATKLEGIGSNQETAGSGREEVVGAFENGRASVTPFGRTVADQEAGDVAFDETQVEIGEQVAETLVGATLLPRE